MRTMQMLLLLLVVASGAVAAPPGVAENWDAGNQAYRDGNFAAAAEAYAAIRATGVTAPELEFNLGNAYLKEGDLGPAILHYRRALRLDPGYADARENLGYARNLTRDAKPEERRESVWAPLTRLRLGVEAAAAGTVLALAGFLLVAAVRLVRGWNGFAAVLTQAAAGALVLLLGSALLFEWTELTGAAEGVIVAPVVEVRSGPAESYTVSFRLHPGTEVEVLRESGGWREIRVTDRLRGWAPNAAVTPI